MGATGPPPVMKAEAATAGTPARHASRWAAGLHRALVFGLYLVGGALATAAISHPGLVNERGGLISLVRGDAHNPHARRVLAPTLIRGIRGLLPPALRAAAERRGREMSSIPATAYGGYAETRRAQTEGYWDYVLAGVVLNVVCFSGFLFGLRALLALLFRPPPFVADLFQLLALMAVPVFGEFSTLAYDYPQLCLFTLGLLIAPGWRDVPAPGAAGGAGSSRRAHHALRGLVRAG